MKRPLLIVLLWCGAAVAHAAYTFTQINDFEKQGIPVGATAISPKGVVVFNTWVLDWPVGSKYTMYAGRGGAVTKIADTSGPLAVPNRLWNPDINLSGAVAFASYLDAPGVVEPLASGLFKGSGGALTTVAKYPRGAFATDAAMNDSGQVASVVTWAAGSSSVVTFAPSRTIATYDNPANTFGAPDVNNLGLVAFATKTPTEERIVVSPGGGKLKTVASTKGTNFANLINAEPRLADTGSIAFLADLKTGGQGVFVADWRGVHLIADTTGAYKALESPAINNHGEVVFTARLEDGNSGVFSGPNPVLDRIVGPGDFLGGQVVVSAATGSRSLNDAGQVAFTAYYASERTLVFRADPTRAIAAIPEPSTLLLALTACAIFEIARRRSRT